MGIVFERLEPRTPPPNLPLKGEEYWIAVPSWMNMG